MGCGASTPVVNLAEVDGGMTSGIDGMVTTGRAGFKLKEKFFSGWSGDDFDIKDETGAVVLNALSLHNRMYFKKPDGRKVAMLQENLLDNLQTTYQLYSLTPNFEGQEPKETIDGVAWYRYGFLQK